MLPVRPPPQLLEINTQPRIILPNVLGFLQTLTNSNGGLFPLQHRSKMTPTVTSLANDSECNPKLGSLGKTVSGKKLRIRSYPKFESLEEERLYRKQHLAAAFRVYVPSSWSMDIANSLRRFAERGFDEGVAGHMYIPLIENLL